MILTILMSTSLWNSFGFFYKHTSVKDVPKVYLFLYLYICKSNTHVQMYHGIEVMMLLKN